MHFFKSLLAVCSLLSLAAASAPAIDIVGNMFFYSNNGSYFPIRGIAYQADSANATAGQTISDPLADGETCKRDLPYLLELKTNVLRVYSVNISLDHTTCMDLFNDAGIYILMDLSTPDHSIDRADPEWTVSLYDHYTAVVDAFHNYTNLLGFFAGNEVTNNRSNTEASAYVKAAVRDTKSYIKAKDYRSIPVGYSANDDSYIRDYMAEYFACGDTSSRVDFYGMNMYEWCCNATFETSGFADRVTEFKNLTFIPLFFSEYGCNSCTPRTFDEVNAIFSSEMWDVFSGGVVYMYYEEVNNYGLVTIESSGDVSTLADFDNLKSRMATVSTATFVASSASATAVSTDFSCPSSDQSLWKPGSVLPPTPNEAVCKCITPASGCVVADSVSSDDYSDLFSYLCSEVSCSGISGDTIDGTYGAFSFCDPKDQLNFLLNLYYESNGKSSAACDFSGSASIKTDVSTAGSCTSILSAAGTAGTGSVSVSVDYTAVGTSAASASATGSSSSASSTTSKKSSAVSVNSKGIYILGASLLSIFAGMLIIL